jgi:hypothetical protein
MMTTASSAGWRSMPLAAAALALALAMIGYPTGTRAQGLVEKDPDKCALINVAHFYLRCANFQLHLIYEQQRLIADKPSPQIKAVLGATLKETKDLHVDYLSVAIFHYNLAGLKLDKNVVLAREKVDLPYIKAAFEEVHQRVRQDNTGKRNPPKPNILDLCSRSGLGAEAKHDAKIQERRLQFKREAEQLAQNGKSCIK